MPKMASVILWRFQHRPVGLFSRERSSTESSFVGILPYPFSRAPCRSNPSQSLCRSPLHLSLDLHLVLSPPPRRRLQKLSLDLPPGPPKSRLPLPKDIPSITAH